MVTVDDRRETVSLIGSDKVEGAAVYGKDGRKIGSVQRVMIDKISGKIAYAVVSFGGVPRHGRRVLPNALGYPQVRYWPGRLPRQHDRGPAKRCTEIQSEHRLGLVGPFEGPDYQ